MRTTLLSQSRQLLANLRVSSGRRLQAADQISSGLRVRKPSDSPSDAAGVVRVRSDLASIGKFRSNLESSQAELRAVDGAMFDVERALDRALTLASQAASDTQTDSSREMIASEVEVLRRHVMSIANSVHNGRRLFGGSLDTEAPFVDDAASASGVSYRGDAVSRSVLFPDGRPAAISLPGDAIFMTAEKFRGAGRTAPPAGVTTNPPIGVGVAFEGSIQGVISADLKGPFVASAAPAGAGAGDIVSVRLRSDDGGIDQTVSVTLAGGEDATALAGLLNAEISANSALAGKVSWSDEGGSLALSVSDSAGAGFSFTSTSAGAVTTGLEGGGSAGGYSAAEIAAALQAQVDANPDLAAAGVKFTVVDGQVEVDGNLDFTFTAVDFARGTSFASGLGGEHRVGGANSADVFGTLTQLLNDLQNNDRGAVGERVDDLQRALDHVSGAHGFFGAALKQVEVTLDTLSEREVVNKERLSLHQDADLVAAITELQQATSAEEFALQVAARKQTTLLDVLG